MTERRAAAWDALGSARFDLLVIGGGIIGAGIANEATRAGLRVALVDRGDFGAATSSASSKLIHGGLRYLRMGDVRLVRESHRERRALLRVVAPHLVASLPFLFPVYRDGPYRPLTIRFGLAAYSALAGDRLGGLVGPDRAQRSVPGLRLDDLAGCGVYRDAWTHDGRLCLANVRAAEEGGAIVLNYAEVVELCTVDGRVAGAEVRDRLDGSTTGVSARTVVNATGPWLDELRRLEDPSAVPAVRLSKGVHVLVALDEPWSAALTIPQDKVRVSFAYPWEGGLLLGTTDTLYEGDPADVAATAQDVEHVFEEAAIAIEPRLLDPARVVFTWAGLRVLPGSGGDTASSRRETVYLRGTAGMLTVAGGKLTTYRSIALKTLDRLRGELGLGTLDRRPVPLPGAADAGSVAVRIASRTGLPQATAAHLARYYGTLADDVVALAEARPELLEPLHPDGPDIAAQVVYAGRSEWATNAADVLERRTSLAYRGLATPEVVARVESLLQESWAAQSTALTMPS